MSCAGLMGRVAPAGSDARHGVTTLIGEAHGDPPIDDCANAAPEFCTFVTTLVSVGADAYVGGRLCELGGTMVGSNARIDASGQIRALGD